MQFLTMCGLAGTTAAMSLALLLDVTQGPEGESSAIRFTYMVCPLTILFNIALLSNHEQHCSG